MRTALTLAVLIASSAAAVAGDGTVLVIPGRPGVPVIISGRDASYAVVEGEWGLAKNIQIQPIVYGGYDPYPPKKVGHYYPTLGHKPGYGRLEIEPSPDRKLPKPAASYSRSWSAESAPPPAVITQESPPVIVAPQIGGGLPYPPYPPYPPVMGPRPGFPR